MHLGRILQLFGVLPSRARRYPKLLFFRVLDYTGARRELSLMYWFGNRSSSAMNLLAKLLCAGARTSLAYTRQCAGRRFLYEVSNTRNAIRRHHSNEENTIRPVVPQSHVTAWRYSPLSRIQGEASTLKFKRQRRVLGLNVKPPCLRRSSTPSLQVRVPRLRWKSRSSDSNPETSI